MSKPGKAWTATLVRERRFWRRERGEEQAGSKPRLEAACQVEALDVGLKLSGARNGSPLSSGPDAGSIRRASPRVCQDDACQSRFGSFTPRERGSMIMTFRGIR